MWILGHSPAAMRLDSVLVFSVLSLFSFSAHSEDLASLQQRLSANTELQSRLFSGTFPSFDPRHQPPASAPHLFQLSQNYPIEYDSAASLPWEEIDVATHPIEYLYAVLAYCLEGNIEVEFVVQNNGIRKWYHAPWMHDDGEPNGAGRECLRGMTRERRSREFELHPLQTKPAQNWAIGFYNDRGGYTLRKVWQTTTGFPEPSAANFPAGTVSFKLLFTDASPEQVPFLDGSLQWEAHVYQDTRYEGPRVVKTMRLLQVDIAVKEPRVASASGWVFGTFVYDASAPGRTLLEKLIPVGASWGDDPLEQSQISRDGVFVNTRLKESRLNSFLVEKSGVEYGKRAFVKHHGLGGRLNGPVDNPVSSCISCHGRAASYHQALPLNPDSGLPMPFAYFNAPRPSQFPSDQFQRFFRRIPGGSHLEVDGNKTFVTTDYSLQISAGIRNFYQSLRSAPPSLETMSKADLMSVTPDSLRRSPKLPVVTREID